MTESSILYQNTENTIFLVDIPTSIAFAQALSPVQQQPLPPLTSSPNIHFTEEGKSRPFIELENKRKFLLLSSSPLKEPYPPSSEPRTDTARAKVLEKIPVSERVFQTDIVEPLVQYGLTEIRKGYSKNADWCVDRKIRDESNQRKREWEQSEELHSYENRIGGSQSLDPPVILSSGLNSFSSLSELRNAVVRNSSSRLTILRVRSESEIERAARISSSEVSHHTFYVPPLANFLLCTLPIAQQYGAEKKGSLPIPIPGLPPNQKFNLILLDPPWPNRSVRRSGHYHTQSYFDMDLLSKRIRDILKMHLQDSHMNSSAGIPGGEPVQKQAQISIAAIWITNAPKARKAAYDAIQGAGLAVCEEWVWIKTTTQGQPITPLDGLWRKPYEILVIGKRQSSCKLDSINGRTDTVTRRVIAAVPDVHSRKPNLREVFENVFFACSSSLSDDKTSGTCVPYSALEVFARNLTAGWWACGDEALKFNSEEWWMED